MLDLHRAKGALSAYLRPIGGGIVVGLLALWLFLCLLVGTLVLAGLGTWMFIREAWQMLVRSNGD